jgi:lysyl-tRNA synthetase class 1
MHWADAYFRNVKGDQTISTGISPSGPIHVGNMREILTGDILYKASLKNGLKSRFIYLCDDMDPLRKIYPFLDSSYGKYVGKPLYRIPSPAGKGTYSEYFLAPFLETLGVLNVTVEVIRTSNLYATGKFQKAIEILFQKKDEVADILEKISGRKLNEEWSPYEPICEKCGSITTTTVTSFTSPFVDYTCKCGHSGRSDIRRDDGKMPWRIEWPAKWYALSVTIEPFGKDHGAAGGSYDTGKAIAEKIFGINPPAPLLYERIFLKGMGVMHSSTGISIAANEVLKFAPPAIMRFIIAKNNPSRHIDFDPGIGLLNLVDEYEKYLSAYYGEDTVGDPDFRSVVEYSSTGKEVRAPEVSFRHIVNLVQIYGDDKNLLRALQKGGYKSDTLDAEIKMEIQIVRNWLSSYAPESVKFRLLGMNDPSTLNETDQKILREFVSAMDMTGWNPEDIHNAVHEIIKRMNVPPAEGFGAFYKALIGKERGPRLGYFLSNLDREFVKKRLLAVTTHP